MTVVTIPLHERAPRLTRSDTWRQAFIEASGGRCHYCNRPGDSAGIGPDDRPWHLDHKTPLAKGGEDVEENFALACKRCNLAKSVTSYQDFCEFARRAFWQPSDWRLSAYDLKLLEVLHANFARHVERVTGRESPAIIVDRVEGKLFGQDEDDCCLELLAVSSEYTNLRRYDPSAGLLLMERCYALLPRLIAELRMCRDELGMSK